MQTIELMPNTWSNVLPMLIVVLENGSEEGRKMAREELAKMAKAADMAVAAQKEGKL